MRRRKHNSPVRCLAKKIWVSRRKDHFSFNPDKVPYEFTYYYKWRFKIEDRKYAKLKRKKFYIKDYNFMKERHSPKWWKNIQERKFRAKTKQFVYKVSVWDSLWDRNYEFEDMFYIGRHPFNDLILPHPKKPWDYFW